MDEKWRCRKVPMPNGITIEAIVLECELEGTDEEFLARNPQLCESVDRLVAELRG